MTDDRDLTNEHPRATAADWYARTRSGRMTPEEAARFETWLQADPTHAREIHRLDAMWAAMDAMTDAPEVAAGRRHAAALQADARARRRWSRLGGLVPLRAVAASVLALAAVAVTLLILDQAGPRQYRTALGEQRTVSLADGSVVTLNTQTTLRVRYSATERRLELIDGQAAFDVAPDPGRRFVVMAGGSMVRALGTRFDVYKAGDTVTVTLLEGKLEVRRLQPPPAPPVEDARPAEPAVATAAQLVAGEQIRLADDGAMTAMAKVDVARVSAWRAGKIDLDDTPLAEAVAEVNRYSELKIVLGDDSLGALRVSGVFEAGRSEDVVKALQSYFGVKAVRSAADRIVLTADDRADDRADDGADDRADDRG